MAEGGKAPRGLWWAPPSALLLQHHGDPEDKGWMGGQGLTALERLLLLLQPRLCACCQGFRSHLSGPGCRVRLKVPTPLLTVAFPPPPR